MKSILFSLFFFLSFAISTFAQTFEWATNEGGIQYDVLSATAIDQQNNLFISGTFDGKWAWQSGDTLKSKGAGDFFLARTNNAGNLEWVVGNGGNLDDALLDIALSPQQDAVFAAGFVRDSLLLGTDTIETASSSDADALLMRCDVQNGAVQWTQTLKTKGDAEFRTVASDQTGNVYAAGVFADSLFIAGDSIKSAGSYDIVLAKFNGADGSLLWYRIFGGAQSDEVTDMQIDPATGKIVLTGFFTGFAIWQTYNALSAGDTDLFLVAINAEGGVEQLITAGGEGIESANSLAIDNQGNYYIAGNFVETAQIGQFALTANGSSDWLLAKWNAQGELQWAKAIGSSQTDKANTIAADANNNVYVAGYFADYLTADDLYLQSNGSTDILVVKLNADGNVLWVQGAGGQQFDNAKTITLDNEGYCYIAGNFTATADFDEAGTLQSNGNADLFWAKINQSTIDLSTATVQQMSFDLFPNPASSHLSLQLPPQQTLPLPIQLINSSGQIVLQHTIAQNLENIDIRHLPTGCYILHANNGSYAKVVISR